MVQVEQRDVPVYREWIGTLDGMVNAAIRAQVTGYLLRQGYSEGSFVRKGQLLFEIDPRPFQAAVDQAQGQLAQANAQVAQAKAQLVEAQARLVRQREHERRAARPRRGASGAHPAACELVHEGPQQHVGVGDRAHPRAGAERAPGRGGPALASRAG